MIRLWASLFSARFGKQLIANGSWENKLNFDIDAADVNVNKDRLRRFERVVQAYTIIFDDRDT